MREILIAIAVGIIVVIVLSLVIPNFRGVLTTDLHSPLWLNVVFAATILSIPWFIGSGRHKDAGAAWSYIVSTIILLAIEAIIFVAINPPLVRFFVSLGTAISRLISGK